MKDITLRDAMRMLVENHVRRERGEELLIRDLSAADLRAELARRYRLEAPGGEARALAAALMDQPVDDLLLALWAMPDCLLLEVTIAAGEIRAARVEGSRSVH